VILLVARREIVCLLLLLSRLFLLPGLLAVSLATAIIDDVETCKVIPALLLWPRRFSRRLNASTVNLVVVVVVVDIAVEQVVAYIDRVVEALQVVHVAHAQRAAVEVDVAVAVVEGVAQVKTEAETVDVEVEVEVGLEELLLVEDGHVVEGLQAAGSQLLASYGRLGDLFFRGQLTGLVRRGLLLLRLLFHIARD